MKYSVFRLLISFRQAPWNALIYYVQTITNKTGGLYVTYFRFTVNISTVSYQYCSYLYSFKIHLRVYI